MSLLRESILLRIDSRISICASSIASLNIFIFDSTIFTGSIFLDLIVLSTFVTDFLFRLLCKIKDYSYHFAIKRIPRLSETEVQWQSGDGGPHTGGHQHQPPVPWYTRHICHGHLGEEFTQISREHWKLGCGGGEWVVSSSSSYQMKTEPSDWPPLSCVVWCLPDLPKVLLLSILQPLYCAC